MIFLDFFSFLDIKYWVSIKEEKELAFFYTPSLKYLLLTLWDSCISINIFHSWVMQWLCFLFCIVCLKKSLFFFFFFGFPFYLCATYSSPNSQIRSNATAWLSLLVCVCDVFPGAFCLPAPFWTVCSWGLMHSCWPGIFLYYHVGNSWLTCLLNSISPGFLFLWGEAHCPLASWERRVYMM